MKFNAVGILLTLLTLIFVNVSLFSQNEEYRFNHGKTLGDKQVVYFKIAGLPDDKSEQDEILGALLSDSNIFDGNIYSQDGASSVCQLEIDYKVTVSYVRNLLQTTGYDIDLSSVSATIPSKPAGIYQSESHSFFEGFDGYKDYDINNSSVSVEEHYAKNKEEWVKNNPDLYKQAKKETGTTVVVKRKDLNSFNEQKRQHILSHPEIFIIED